MDKAFKIIQKVGILAMNFETTNKTTLKFNEAKSLVVLVLGFCEDNNIDPSELLKEVTNQKGG